MKALIVDDEIYMLDCLVKLIEWEKYGITEVLTANGGSMAKKLIEIHKPELLLTDIRMPKISGLDLCKYIKEEQLNTKIVILSGYGEFEYARQAIQYGVSEYLVKPILKETLEKTVSTLMRNQMPSSNIACKKDSVIENIKQYIKDHAEEDLTLEILGRHFFMHPAYLSRYFKEETGENLSSFITGIKMERSAELLKNSDKKISEIMILMGYQKKQHFAKLFRDKYGMTPRDYRIKERK